MARLRAAGGRARVSELVADRPSLRGAIRRLEELGVLRLETEREMRAPGWPAAARGRRAHADRRPDEGARRAAARGRGRRLQPVPAARRHRQRQDRGLLPGRRGGARSRPRGDPARAGDRPHADAGARGSGRASARRFRCCTASSSAGERHDEWWRIREGEARVVVGARSAVFAPVADLGLIVVDEEHDGAYKQDESPRYHGRDVAVMRARLEACPVVLGSATPAVESYANAQSGKYRELLLPKRISGAGPAEGRDRGPARGAAGRRRADPEPAAARGARRAARSPRAGAAAAQPPRLRDEPAVPRVRPGGHVPELLGLADAPPHRAAGALPLLRPRDAHARRLPVVPRRLPAAHRLRDGEGRRGRGRGAARPRRSSGWTGTARAAAACCSRRSPPSSRARSTSWWARR